MENDEKIKKLQEALEESFKALKLLPDLLVCERCEQRNFDKVEEILAQTKKAIDLSKEIK